MSYGDILGESTRKAGKGMSSFPFQAGSRMGDTDLTGMTINSRAMTKKGRMRSMDLRGRDYGP